MKTPKEKRIRVLEEQRRRDWRRLNKIGTLAGKITNITKNVTKGRKVK